MEERDRYRYEDDPETAARPAEDAGAADAERMDAERRAEARRPEDPADEPTAAERDAAAPAEGRPELRRAGAQRADADEPAGADEQLTVPEDRDAAAVAEGRPAVGTAPNGDDRPFELFSGSDVSGYRQRWDTLQASFVDDPKRAADQAEALIGEMVERVTRRHQELRDELGGRADRGDDTEARRLALRRYRAFFHTLVGE